MVHKFVENYGCGGLYKENCSTCWVMCACFIQGEWFNLLDSVLVLYKGNGSTSWIVYLFYTRGMVQPAG